jgi:hypothetical protein
MIAPKNSGTGQGTTFLRNCGKKMKKTGQTNVSADKKPLKEMHKRFPTNF